MESGGEDTRHTGPSEAGSSRDMEDIYKRRAILGDNLMHGSAYQELDDQSRGACTKPTTNGPLPMEIWLLMIDQESQLLDQLTIGWSDSICNPYFTPQGHFVMDGHDTCSLYQIQRLNKTLHYEVIKAVLKNTTMLFHDHYSLSCFMDTFRDYASGLVSGRKIRKMSLRWDLLMHETTLTEAAQAIKELHSSQLIDLDHLAITLVSSRFWLPASEILPGHRKEFEAVLALTKIPTKKIEIVADGDEEMWTWVEGFVNGDWTAYDALLAGGRKYWNDDLQALHDADHMDSLLSGTDWNTHSAWQAWVAEPSGTVGRENSALADKMPYGNAIPISEGQDALDWEVDTWYGWACYEDYNSSNLDSCSAGESGADGRTSC